MSEWRPSPPRMQAPTNIEDVGGPLGARWVDVQIRGEYGDSTFALQDDGTLWGWGQNDTGQLGIGMMTERHEFIIQPVVILDDVAEFFMTRDGLHGLVIRDDNSLWGWGSNREGQLGDGTTSRQLQPIWIMDDVAEIIEITVRGMPLILKNDNSLWYLERGGPEWVADDVSVVLSSNLVVKTDGNLWRLDADEPTLFLEDVATALADMAITTDGVLWGWGDNRHGQIGDGTTQERLMPVRIMEDVVAVSNGASHTMAITADGRLWGWGDNRHGQAGVETLTLQSYNRLEEDEQEAAHLAGEIVWEQLSPVWIMDDVAYVSAFGHQTMAITTDGTLWGWGQNNWGQLGLESDAREDQSSPAFIMNGVQSIAHRFTDRAVTRVIKTDGSLWFLERGGPAWEMDDVAEVFSEGGSTFVVTNDGELWFWGSNWIAQEGEYEGAISILMERGFWDNPLVMLAMIFVFMYLIGVIPIVIIIFIVMTTIAFVRHFAAKKEEKNLNAYILSETQSESTTQKRIEKED